MKYPVYTQDKDLLEYYLIRDKDTKEHLPIPRDDKTSAEFTYILPPRLFRRVQDAKKCLTYWRKGRGYVNFDGRINFQEVDGRKGRDIEIIKVYIIQESI